MERVENPKLKHNETSNIIEITQSPFVIGRALTCDYVIANEIISRKHCVLENCDNKWLIRDFSRNGIYINGNIVKKEQIINNKDIIILSPEGNTYTVISTSIPAAIPSRIIKPADAQDTANEERNIPIENNLPVSDSDNADLLNCDAELEAVLGALSTSVPSSPQPISSVDPKIAISVMENPHPVPLPSVSVIRELSSPEDTPLPKKIKITNTAMNNVSLNDNLESSEQCNIEVLSAETCTAKAQTGTVKTTSQDNLGEMEDEMQCSICSEMFIQATTLNCSHSFCKYCIETWKKTKNICPICRTKITSLNATLVLDNVIEKVIQNASEEVQNHRKTLLSDRQKAAAGNSGRGRTANRRGRGGYRGRRGNGGSNNEQLGEIGNNLNELRDNLNELGQLIRELPDEVLTVDSSSSGSISSSSSSSSSLSSSSSSFIDSDNVTEPYHSDNERWEPGIPGVYYGGYGHCYNCGRRGHWANGCPFA